MSGSYTIKLPQFEGPFDLLLFFIERDELDINDIPIHQITEEFLGYIRIMESMNIDLASEFILVAATLCRIKAKMLIPRQPIDDEGNEIDPREELIRRLIEYKRYKSVLEDMRRMEEERAGQVLRGNASKEIQDIATKALVDVELESLTLYKLLKAFERVMLRFEDANAPKKVHTILQYAYDIAGQQSYIYSCLEPGKQSKFEDIFGHLENRIHAIVTFLALLELLNLQRVKIVSGLGPNNFWLELDNDSEEEE